MLVLLLIPMILLSGCGGGYTSDNPCIYCNDTPTKKFDALGGDCYICEKCSTTCAFCGKKATKEYQNGFGYPTFVCNSCYESLKSFQ